MALFGADRCCCGSASCEMADCRYASSDLADAEVSVDSLIASGGTPATATLDSVQDSDFGHELPSRKLTIEQTGTAAADTHVYSVLILNTGAWTPPSQCGIASVTFCLETFLKLESDITSKVCFACRQDGKIYVAGAHTPRAKWKVFRGTFVEENFSRIITSQLLPDTAQHPDFSGDGKPIQFGLVYRGEILSGDTAKQGTLWIDNVCITRVDRSDDCGTCGEDECFAGKYSLTIQNFQLVPYGGASATILAIRDEMEDFFNSTLILNTSMSSPASLVSGCTGVGCGCMSVILSSVISIPGGYEFRAIIRLVRQGDGTLGIGLEVGVVETVTFSHSYGVAQCQYYDDQFVVFPELVIVPNDAVYQTGDLGGLSFMEWSYDSITLTPIP